MVDQHGLAARAGPRLPGGVAVHQQLVGEVGLPQHVCRGILHVRELPVDLVLPQLHHQQLLRRGAGLHAAQLHRRRVSAVLQLQGSFTIAGCHVSCVCAAQQSTCCCSTAVVQNQAQMGCLWYQHPTHYKRSGRQRLSVCIFVTAYHNDPAYIFARSGEHAPHLERRQLRALGSHGTWASLA